MFVCRMKIDMCIKFAVFRQLDADIIRNCLTIAKKNFFSRKKKRKLVKMLVQEFLQSANIIKIEAYFFSVSDVTQ